MPLTSVLAHAFGLIVCWQQVIYQQEQQKFQGDWKVSEASYYGESVPFFPGDWLFFSSLDAHFRIKGAKLRPLASGKRPKEEPGDFDLYFEPFLTRGVSIFWFVGIYEFRGKDCNPNPQSVEITARGIHSK
jgi:hypothetical protein